MNLLGANELISLKLFTIHTPGDTHQGQIGSFFCEVQNLI